VAQYVGLDVGLEWTSICVIDQEGAVVWRGRAASEPERIAAAVRARAPQAAAIGLETGALSTWLWHGLRQQGVAVVCLDARDAKAVLARQLNKTDANDAFGLAQLVRSGWYRAVAVKSLAAHRLQCLLRARARLIALQRDLANHLRGTLKVFGRKLGRGRGQAFARRVREVVSGEATLEPLAASLLAVWDEAGRQIAELDRRLALARRSAACRRLMTVPGVGAMTALSFAAVIDDPRPFAKSSGVGACLGLTPNATSPARSTMPVASRAGATARCVAICTRPPSCSCSAGAALRPCAPGACAWSSGSASRRPASRLPASSPSRCAPWAGGDRLSARRRQDGRLSLRTAAARGGTRSLPGRRFGRGRCQACGVLLDDRVSHLGRPGVRTRHRAAAPADRGDNLAPGRSRPRESRLDRN
jgi:transposase